MAALQPGKQAPNFNLVSTHGEPHALEALLARGHVLAAFLKVSCPVCQLAFPFLQRIAVAYPGAPFTVLGISQDDRSSTEAFMREYGVTFPVLLDDPAHYRVSNDYGLTNVPTAFLITPEGSIATTIVGWSLADYEALNADLALIAGLQEVALVGKNEQVPTFKPG